MVAVRSDIQPFWRHEDPELSCPECNVRVEQYCKPCDRRGVVTRGGMFAHQREWWEAKREHGDKLMMVKMLVTGYGGGKTITMCKRAINAALRHAPHLVAAISPTFAMAQETIISTIRELLTGKATLEPLSWTYNKTEHVFNIHFRGRKARLKVFSGEDPDRLKGFNAAAAYIDEPFIQEQEVFIQTTARCRHPAIPVEQREIGLTGTPEQLNWGYELAEGELKEQWRPYIVQASTDANLAMGEDYLNQLSAGHTGLALDAYRHGKFVNLAKGQVFYGFDRQRSVRELDAPMHCEWGVGMDFGSARNFATMAAVVFWRDNTGHMHIVAEFEQANSDTPTMCDTLARHYPQVFVVYPDATGNRRQSASGTSDFYVLRQNGYQVKVGKTNPEIRDRMSAHNYMLESGKLTIDPSCKSLIKYHLQLSYEQINKQKQMTHLTDAVGYPCYRFNPPVPKGIQRRRL